jgi:hypothetical protein
MGRTLDFTKQICELRQGVLLTSMHIARWHAKTLALQTMSGTGTPAAMNGHSKRSRNVQVPRFKRKVALCFCES